MRRFTQNSRSQSSSCSLKSWKRPGGHAFAAGLTVKARHFHTFKQALQESLKEESIAENDEDYFDLEISQKQIEATLEEIEKYGPYGEGNQQILIKITDLTLISSGGSNYYKTFFRGRGG